MPVFNKMVYNGTEYILGGGGNIGEPLNLTVTTSGLDATIKWEDNEIGTIPPTTFQKSELIRKIGSAPTSPSDGDLVVTETVKDTYKVSGYVDQGLTDGETYYYRVFSYSDLGGISYCDAVNVTPSGGGWQDIDDSFIGTTLDTSVWEAIQFGNEGSYAINNGLSISSGPDLTGSSGGEQFLQQGYVLSTKGKFLGTESKITAEVTYTGYDNISYDGGSFSILGTECRNGQGAMDSVTGVVYTTRQSRGYALSYFGGTEANLISSYTVFSNPTTIKLELDIANNTSNMYINGALSTTKTNVLYSGKSWNDYIGNPIFTLSPRYGASLTIHVSNIKVTVE